MSLLTLVPQRLLLILIWQHIMAHAHLQSLQVIYDYLSNVDSLNYRSLVNILMAVENLTKDSLFLIASTLDNIPIEMYSQSSNFAQWQP